VTAGSFRTRARLGKPSQNRTRTDTTRRALHSRPSHSQRTSALRAPTPGSPSRSEIPLLSSSTMIRYEGGSVMDLPEAKEGTTEHTVSNSGLNDGGAACRSDVGVFRATPGVRWGPLSSAPEVDPWRRRDENL
jgi:hypothetical protein